MLATPDPFKQAVTISALRIGSAMYQTRRHMEAYVIDLTVDDGLSNDSSYDEDLAISLYENER